MMSSPFLSGPSDTGSNAPATSTSNECRMLLNVARYYDVIARLVDILDQFSAPEAISVIHKPELQQVLVCYGEIIEEECPLEQEQESTTVVVPPELLLALEQDEFPPDDILAEQCEEMIVFEDGEESGGEELQDLVAEEPVETDEEIGIEFEVEEFEVEEEDHKSAVSEYYVEYLQDGAQSEGMEETELGDSGERYKCQFVACDRRFGQYKDYQDHLRMGHLPVVEKATQLQCKYSDCSEVFDDTFKLYVHHKTHGGGEQISRGSICRICREKFDTKEELKKHLKVHKNPPVAKPSSKQKILNRKCEFCEESFDPKINVYNIHCLEAHGRPLYNCFVCGKTFYLLAHLTEHIKSGHDVNTAESFIMESLWRTFQEENVTVNECRMCFRLFSSPKAEMQHQEFHLKELSVTCPNCGGRHQQSQCNEPRPKFGVVYEKVQCEQCHRWMSKKNIKEHIATHANERNYPCTVCKKTFKVQRTAHRHIQNHINAQNKTRKCYDCDQVFTEEEKLPKHYQTCHPGRYPYNCPICGEGFYQKPKLADHTHKHTDEERKRISVKNPVQHYQVGNARVYECTLCRRGFSAKRTVVAHFIVHTDRPFACELCGASYRAKPALDDHMMEAHKVKMEA